MNSILIQPGENHDTLENSVFDPDQNLVVQVRKKMRRSLQTENVQIIPEYIRGKRIGPQPAQYTQDEERDFLLADQDLLYLTWVLSRIASKPQCIPSWTGFNIRIRDNVTIHKSYIGYLDCLDAPATDSATIYYLLCRSLAIKDKLELESMVCVYDQAIFAKAIEIQFKEKEKFDSLILVMGGFHTLMFLGIVGTRFKDAGLRDLLIQSGVLADGSADRALNGKMYNRSVRAYMLMYEALFRMLLVDLEEQNNCGTIRTIYDALPDEWSHESFGSFINTDELRDYNIAVIDHKDKLLKENPLAQFWLSFMDMITTLLNFIYSFRAGTWQLYLESVRSMLPWVFAYDCYNYARYLTTYFMNMLHLKETHPNVYAEFMDGNFTVQC